MIIPEETQALERLKNTLLAEGYWQDVLEDINIIGNALDKYYRLLKEDNETTKKLKALEIIVSKRLNVDEIYHKDYEWYMLNHKNDDKSLIPTKEEFNLLKKVLL